MTEAKELQFFGTKYTEQNPAIKHRAEHSRAKQAQSKKTRANKISSKKTLKRQEKKKSLATFNPAEVTAKVFASPQVYKSIYAATALGVFAAEPQHFYET